MSSGPFSAPVNWGYGNRNLFGGLTLTPNGAGGFSFSGTTGAVNVSAPSPAVSTVTATAFSGTTLAFSAVAGATSGLGYGMSDGANSWSLGLTGATVAQNTGNAIPYTWYTGGNLKMTLAGAGQLGVGVTPTGNFWLETLGPAQHSGVKLCNMYGGASTGDYPRVGYNFRTTSSAGTYQYDVNDYASLVRFVSGGIQFDVTSSGTAGSSIVWTTIATFANLGQVSLFEPSFGVFALCNAATTQTGSFSATISGMSGAGNTQTVVYSRVGAMVTLTTSANSFTGTSTTTGPQFTANLTPTLTPARQQTSAIIVGAADNGSACGMTITVTAYGTVTFQKVTAVGTSTPTWTASGTMTLAPFTFTYLLN